MVHGHDHDHRHGVTAPVTAPVTVTVAVAVTIMVHGAAEGQMPAGLAPQPRCWQKLSHRLLNMGVQESITAAQRHLMKTISCTSQPDMWR
ncbi:hypothetical protein K504DRAFT_498396 [Pleomassaria siparia CBS 279.74]|uniref:Uncharacterized protein n=1 Tax=Pleomassaria siparia CBS 279.74 TaxID=1314801 RepID=A0A6G1KM81_9PLEO|nr:hypothetical protein K504DRAFT_498396 [Pleomassaria siparia CBS 279.74]